MTEEITATPPAITINQEYANLVPPLSAEEYDGLKQSIKQNGLWVPITVNSQGIILDGHHRFKACQELGIEPRTNTKDFPDKLAETLFVIYCNLTRRHLNNFQRTELALKSKSILEQIAKNNMSSGGRGVEIQTPLGRIDEQIGKRAGVGKDTVRRVQTIIEKAPEEVKQNARTGKMSINEAIDYTRLQEQPQQRKQNNKHHTDRSDQQIAVVAAADLTPKEKEYVQEVKDEFERDDWIDRFIELWTGKTVAEQGRIMRETERGANWRRELVEESRDHILTKAKRMTDAHVTLTYNYMRTLGVLAEAIGDVLYEELEARKRKAALEGV
jgi:ParB-like chromosome segregation protein Spo0J